MALIKRILIADDGKKFYIKDLTQDYHCQFGVVKQADFKKKSVTTNTGKILANIPASFIDNFKKIRRGAQIIPLKDIGVIIAKTGINNKTIVVDAGSGSGALCCNVALRAKQVYSYDIRDDHLEIAQHNQKMLGIKNLIIEKRNIYDGIPVKNVDVITLDTPEPWEAIPASEKVLKSGGFIVSYSPSIPQVADFVNAIRANKNFIHIETLEIHEREWEVDGRKVRPKTRGLGHSGFLSFARKL